MRKLKTLGSALVVALVLVTCADYVGYAATGSSFILGRSNSATKVTGLARTTTGPALNLHTAAASNPPFVTNATGKVVNLNADRLDGFDSSAMVNKTLVFSTPLSASSVTQFTVTLHSVPAGKYLFNSDGFIYTATTDPHACYLTVPSTGQSVYEWFPADTSGGFIMPNGTGFVTVPTAQDLTYQCYDNNGNPGNYTSYSAQPLQLMLTPMSQVTTTTPGVARVAGTRPRAATR